MDANGSSTEWLLDAAERDHELRASLYGIEAAAAALNSVGQEHQATAELAAAIAAEARRLRAMLQPQPQQLADFDLVEAVRPVVVMARALGVVVQEDLPNSMWVHGRHDDTAQVAFSLLNNARLHAGSSAVEVRVSRNRGTATLYVEDRGPGIYAYVGASLFTRGRSRPQSPGSGLGLFIARKLMLEQSGSLTYRRRPGGGASFGITLPLALPAATRHTVISDPNVLAR